MTDAYPKYWELCKLGDKPFPGDYFFLAQGVLTVAGMDDAEEMRATDTALDTLGFTQSDKDGALISECSFERRGGAYRIWKAFPFFLLFLVHW